MYPEESFQLRSFSCTSSWCLHEVIYSKYQKKP